MADVQEEVLAESAVPLKPGEHAFVRRSIRTTHDGLRKVMFQVRSVDHGQLDSEWRTVAWTFATTQAKDLEVAQEWAGGAPEQASA